MTTLLDTEPRVLAAWYRSGSADLTSHLETHGPLPGGHGEAFARDLIAVLEDAGLYGRGGASFPTATKLRSIRAAHQRPVVAINAMEGEPAGHKDGVLLTCAPHLVLDGAELMARALRAEQVVICVDAGRHDELQAVQRALQERRGGPATPVVSVAALKGGYVAGEESALVDALSGGRGVPRFRPDKAVPLTIRRRPVMVHNAETLAHVALIARHGPDWFKTAGTADAPGTTLIAVSGAVANPAVHEVALGTPVRAILEMAGLSQRPAGVLVGGYGGAWLSGEDLGVLYTKAELAARGVPIGAGILVALGAQSCGITETARIARYMAGESAGQCGPCVFGLPAIADDMEGLAKGRWDARALKSLGHRLERRLASVDGRGACRHPDGVVRLVRSALEVFSSDVRLHLAGNPCPGSVDPALVPVPVPANKTLGRYSA